MQPSPAAAGSELNEVARLLADFTAGKGDALHELRPLLHRVVVARTLSGAVKTHVVQALLLLDDPRVAEGTATGGPLLAKIRKLLESALAAHADGVGLPPPAKPAAQHLEFSPDALLAPDTDRALVEEFVIESREQLAIAEGALLALDGDPGDVAALDAMFRALHTIKGTSAFIGVEHVTELAHHAESLLARVRAGTAVCGGELANLLFRAIDMLDAILVAIETATDGEVAMLPDGFRELLVVLREEPARGAPPRGATTPRISGSVLRVRPIETTVRVRTSDLDRLAGVVRELMLTHDMLSRDTTVRDAAHAELGRKIAYAERLVCELDEVTNGIRNVAFAPTLQRLVRVARDTAYQSGKAIDLATDGDDVLVERATAEALADPLMHMVRNAVDHGIESPSERLQLGKRESGRLRIAARREGVELVIELADDGRGLDPEHLVRTAVERGLISPEAKLTDREAFALILRPGFTTATVVTGLSGRGVGMDVVRSAVATLGGSIAIDSRVGLGTTFTIRLPFRSQSASPGRTAPTDTWGELPRVIGLIA